MTEKDLERRLSQLLQPLRCRTASGDMPPEFVIRNSTSDAKTLLDLLGNKTFVVIEDRSEWNPNPKFMVDIIGNMVPDIVLRSEVSGENRIYIEVKNSSKLGHSKADSQIIRYFLHLLAATHREPLGKAEDIRRAVLLAAPPLWFEDKSNSDAWMYFLKTYAPLASCFGVTLGELHLNENRAV